jgi:hypothetical protein
MSKKTAGIILIVVGLVIAALSLTLDLIGFGRDPGFGYVQQAGTAAGVIVFAAGLLLALRKQAPKK